MRNRAKEPTDDDCLQHKSKFNWEAVKTFINQQVYLRKSSFNAFSSWIVQAVS